MFRKSFYLVPCVVLLCAVSGIQAAMLEITPDAPVPGDLDIANFVGALTDADNVGTEDDSINAPYWNDWCTYVAHDRGGQGQTFVTGNSDVVMTGFWLKHVTYSGADPDQTWYQMQAGAELEIRVTDPAVAGTDAFVLSSETYVITGEEENALPAGATNDQTGTGLWFHITLDEPVALAANTEYGFDLTSLSGKAGVMFFETDGINDRAEGGNPYEAGTAYTSGVNPDDHGDDLNGANDNNMVVAPGDHVFVVELKAAVGQVGSVDDPSDMADSSGDIKRVEAWVDEGNLNLTMTVYGVFAPSVEDTPEGMSNRYYYHWILDTDNNPDTGYFNDEYEGNPTNLETPIGVDVLIQFGWRDGATNGVYAYTLDPSTGDEVELFEDYEYTIDGDTIHAAIPLEDLGLEPDQTIAVSAYQEGASNDWQVDWVESFELTLTTVRAVLFAEDFEGLPLGPTVDEEVAADAVWTDTPPEGWFVDESGIPGIGDPATDGVTEWAGWAFADKAWWTETAGDQDRSLFTLGSGTVAVADPDEWDDADRIDTPIADNPYDTWLSTPEIDVSGIASGTLELKFDSSWRPEFDSNYHQTASISASYDGAKSLVLTFGLYDAGNDWWWAIDNVEVSGLPLPEPVDPGTDNLIAYYALENDVMDSSGNGLDGTIMGDPMFVGGAVGMGLQFDGVDDSVDFGNDPLFDLTGGEVTLSLWVNTQDIGTGQDNPWLGKGDTSYMIKGFRTGNQIEFFIYDGGWNSSFADVGDSFNGEWHHAAGTFNGKQLKIYVDGEEATSLDYEGVGIVNNDYSVGMGTNTQASGRFSESIIDEAMI
jgi:hypothetical protein